MSSAVIYQSKYGATKQYAEWISVALRIPCAEAHTETDSLLKHTDSVVIGTSVYIGKLLISKWLYQNQNKLAGKKIFLFVTCGTPAANASEWQKYIRNSVPLQLQKECSAFAFPGRLRYSELHFKDRFMLRFGAMFAPAADKVRMLQGYDGMQRSEIKPLLNAYLEYYEPARKQNADDTSKVNVSG